MGKAKNIAQRVLSKKHPLQITKDIVPELTCYWQEAEHKRHSLEVRLINEHSPLWNGCTAHGGVTGVQPSGPCCVWDGWVSAGEIMEALDGA